MSKTIDKSIVIVKKRLIDTFNASSDFTLREISIGHKHEIKILMAYIDGLVNKQLVNSDILRPLLSENTQNILGDDPHTKNLLTLIKETILYACEVSEINNFDSAIETILSGDTLIFIDGYHSAISIVLKAWDKRDVNEPPNESVVRGPREGFTETLKTNTSLMRRKIKNKNLIFEKMKLGHQTNTDICICYIKDIANNNLLKSVRERIKNINTDAILESGYIEEFIEDAPLSIFPTVGHSEKPDVIAAKILEGRIAIICDGTPFVLTVPYLFLESIQSAEDYYSRSIYSGFVRLLRAISIFITSMFPAYYVALVCFHQDVIPYKLLMTMSAAREGIPFSALTEALIMVFTFEVLREAGIRMPRPIGQAVSIVGALVIGDAAVAAGLVSTPMIIVIALTAITSFMIPELSGVLLIIRLITMFAANIIGILGIILVSVAILIHMCNLKSFGVFYMSPFMPLNITDLKDTIVRFPLWAMFTRPKIITWEHAGKAKYRTKSSRKGKR